jgi:peptidoglycan/xylan/chitin deacetylase (PgdA/CDA1 family)
MRAAGWRRLVWPKAWFKVGAGLPSWASPIVRVRFQIIGATGKTPSFSFDDLEIGARSRPAELLTFDDGYSAQYTNAFPVMRQHGIRGTPYCWTGQVGYDGYVTWDQFREMAAAGWTIGNIPERIRA